MKKTTTDFRDKENEKYDIQDNPVQGDASLQNDKFDPGENSYLNEYSYSGDENGEENQFAEELSDGGERNELIKEQTNRNFNE
ncbi:hypothetical protein ACE1TI_16195 [Alteribacillus sp. JSM 102045]|uniref:hypothetical protein n=1 Tax=Alteribacillus sp. JSM 102045 TaxID=1562101 RepID=UPI0035BEF0F5